MADELPTVLTRWTDRFNSDPVDDMSKWFNWCLNKWNDEPRCLLCSAMTFSVLKNHPDYWSLRKNDIVSRHKEVIPRWLGLDEVDELELQASIPDGILRLAITDTLVFDLKVY